MVCMIYTLMMKKFLVSVLFHNHSQKARKDKFLLRFIVLLRLYTNICQLKNKKYQFDFL